MVAVVPETEQTEGVVEAKLTARLEVELALRLMLLPTACEAIEPKVID
jgi:hypothetical protein